MKIIPALPEHLLIVTVLMIVSACDQNTNNEMTLSTSSPVQEVQAITPTALEDEATENSQFNIGNTQYLFDVSNHSADEMEALLFRAEEIRETHPDGFNDLEIVLILHGPDINIFKRENYIRHKPLVDLAAKLDSFEIIDIKICEKTMSYMGIDRDEIPAFIESVPYAPDEIRRLGEQGYISL